MKRMKRMIRASKNFRNRLGRLLFHTGRICSQSNLSENSRLYYSHVWECLEQLRNIIDLGIEREYLQTKEEFRAILERDDDKDLVENSETVASFLIELKDEYAGYQVSICDMDGNEQMRFILLQETDFDYLSSIGYKEVLNSKIFAWNIDDDEGDEEIYIEIEDQDE
jgi:hypothetical protein